jgi:hypothetical protein
VSVRGDKCVGDSVDPGLNLLVLYSSTALAPFLLDHDQPFSNAIITRKFSA